MLKHSLKALTLGATLALSAGGAWAQTTSTVNPPETKVGVTPQEAKEATDKAVPRADTGTLVRTAPSAADRAGDMTNDARNAARPNSSVGTNTTPMATTTTGAQPDAIMRASNQNTRRQRAARADRN